MKIFARECRSQSIASRANCHPRRPSVSVRLGALRLTEIPAWKSFLDRSKPIAGKYDHATAFATLMLLIHLPGLSMQTNFG